MENILSAKGLEETIKVPPDPKNIDNRKDKEAKAIIGGALGVEAQSLVVGTNYAFEAWRELTTIYENKTAFEKQDLLSKINSFEIERLSNIAQQIGEVRTMASKLNSIGEPISDENLINIILRGLPKSFRGFARTFRMIPEEQRTLQYLIGNVIAEAKELMADEVQETALYASTNPVRREQWRPRSRERAARSPARSSSRDRNIECYYCKKTGHVIRDCRKLRYNEERRKSGRSSSPAAYMAVRDHVMSKDVWVADSGSTLHITNNKDLLRDYKNLEEVLEIIIGDGSSVTAYGSGCVKTDKMDIGNVYWVPQSSVNLFSVYCATKNGLEARINHNGIKFLNRDGSTALEGRQENGLYILDMKVCKDEILNAERCLLASSLEAWHLKLGHISFDRIIRMIRNKSVEGLDVEEKDKIQCEECVKGKLHRCSHPSRTTPKATKPGLVLHFDTVGPVNPISLGGSKYFLLGKDEFSGFRFVTPVQTKEEIKLEVIKVIRWSSLESLNECVAIKTDNGSEFVNNELYSFLRKRGIEHIKSAAYTPQQNGYIEREVRSVIECARTMVIRSKLDKNLWAEAVACSVYVLNRCVTARNEVQTPYELWYGRKPNVGNLRIFGQRVMVLDTNIRFKFGPKGKEGTFVGYGKTFNTYRILLDSGKIVITADVSFLKSFGQDKEVHSSGSISFEQNGTEDSERNSVSFDDSGICTVPSNNSEDKSEHEYENYGESIPSVESRSVETDENSRDVFFETSDTGEVQIGKPSNIEINVKPSSIRPKPTLNESTNFRMTSSPSNVSTRRAHFTDLDTYGPVVHRILLNYNQEPQTFDEAISSPESNKWKEAMDEEISSLTKNKVWILVEKPAC